MLTFALSPSLCAAVEFDPITANETSASYYVVRSPPQGWARSCPNVPPLVGVPTADYPSNGSGVR
jgi:hypothetical protein